MNEKHVTTLKGKMKVISQDRFGPPDVLHIDTRDMPVPGDGEVLIKVHATSVTKYDCWVRSNTASPGFKFLLRLVSGSTPKQPVLGTEIAGEVVATGPAVRGYQHGDRVFGYTGRLLGAYAEYISLPEVAVAVLPSNVTYEQAAGVLQGALTALYFLRSANIQPGQRVLLFGASGGVGGYAAKLAKRLYGAHVAGVCSGAKADYVRSLGADQVIDYQREDFTERGEVYDVVFDTVGKTSVLRTRKSLRKEGSYLFATFSLSMIIKILWLSLTSKLHLEFGALKESRDTIIIDLGDLLEGVS